MVLPILLCLIKQIELLLLNLDQAFSSEHTFRGNILKRKDMDLFLFLAVLSQFSLWLNLSPRLHITVLRSSSLIISVCKKMTKFLTSSLNRVYTRAFRLVSQASRSNTLKEACVRWILTFFHCNALSKPSLGISCWYKKRQLFSASLNDDSTFESAANL